MKPVFLPNQNVIKKIKSVVFIIYEGSSQSRNNETLKLCPLDNHHFCRSEVSELSPSGQIQLVRSHKTSFIATTTPVFYMLFMAALCTTGRVEELPQSRSPYGPRCLQYFMSGPLQKSLRTSPPHAAPLIPDAEDERAPFWNWWNLREFLPLVMDSAQDGYQWNENITRHLPPSGAPLGPSLTLCSLSFARLRPEHAHTEHAQPSPDMSTEPARISEWKGFVHLLVLHHRGDCGPSPLPAPDPPHPPAHPTGLQTPEGAGQHRAAPGPLHGPDLLLPAHQPAVPLRPRVPPLVQPGLGPAPLEDYPPDGRDHQRGPRPQGADPQAVPGHTQRLSHAGNRNCQWLPAAHGQRALHHCPVLPRTEAPGSLRLLQYLQRGCLWRGVPLPQPGAPGCVR